MTPLQGIAMGLVIVLVDASFGGYDGVPDPVGWVMVLWGIRALGTVLGDVSRLSLLAAVSLAVSVGTYLPEVSRRLDETAGWLLSLPQLAFSFMLCAALAPASGWLAGRFRGLRWVFLALAAGPVIVVGGGVEVLREPLAFAVAGVNIYFVYLLFRASGEVAPEAQSPG